MKSPKIGKQTFLRDNTASESSYDKFINDLSEREANESPLYTGRHFLILNEGNRSVVKATRLLESRFGFSVANTADCPSILAIAALDQAMHVADFSNRALNPNGLVDVAAPGVSVYSSWTMPVRNRTISGTSMATPHVAGICALLCEKYPEATPGMIEIIITLSEVYLDRLSTVADNLRADGLIITHLYAFGVIVGIEEQEVIPKIRNYKEISSLSEEKEVKITPPAADIQSFPDE